METETAPRGMTMFRPRTGGEVAKRPKLPAPELSPVEDALTRLRMAGALIDAAGVTLSPRIAPVRWRALLALSIELDTIEILLSEELKVAGQT